MDVCFFGGYDFEYPRNSVLRYGLAANGARVTQAHVRRGGRFWLRYLLLFLGWWRHGRKRAQKGEESVLFVPEFCHKDVPLAKFLGLLSSRRVVFDPLASRFETKIQDWRRRPEASLAARWNRWLDRFSFRLSDLVLADTQAHKDYYCSTFGLSYDRVEVVPVGFDDRVFTKSLAESKSRKLADNEKSTFTVFFFGSFLPLHGVQTAVQAAALLLKEDKTFFFTFIGSGQTFPEAKRLASELNLGRIAFDGWLSQPVLAERIARQADLVLGIFGRTEKARRVVPHKVFQAMALRKPVLTARTPAAEEFFTHGENIYLCPPGDPESLAQAILELRYNNALRQAIADQGYELVWRNFTPKALGSCLKKILAHRFSDSPGRASVSDGYGL